MIEQKYLDSKNIVTEYVESFTDRNGWKNTSLPDLLKDYKQQLILHGVSQQRELLIAYEKNHYTPQEWVLASKQCIEDIDNFLAINCG